MSCPLSTGRQRCSCNRLALRLWTGCKHSCQWTAQIRRGATLSFQSMNTQGQEKTGATPVCPTTYEAAASLLAMGSNGTGYLNWPKKGNNTETMCCSSVCFCIVWILALNLQSQTLDHALTFMPCGFTLDCGFYLTSLGGLLFTFPWTCLVIEVRFWGWEGLAEQGTVPFS